ncbi:hypothetical protein BTK96_006796 [Burkholderia pyrrocinia]|nr:hypothetical protein [Burkholderia pyrrocinia]EKS9898496.1 hypothetical protein [Burkholderia pyrrocinia]EKS9910151.1 hypothetical protein [Burkholderia pyrrocinia]
MSRLPAGAMVELEPDCDGAGFVTVVATCGAVAAASTAGVLAGAAATGGGGTCADDPAGRLDGGTTIGVGPCWASVVSGVLAGDDVPACGWLAPGAASSATRAGRDR